MKILLRFFFFQRTDVIELANHEAILAQTKEDMKLENATVVRSAIVKERADCMAKLDNELRLASQMVEEKNRELEVYRRREVALTDECQRYKDMIRRLTKSENAVRQTLTEKVTYCTSLLDFYILYIFMSITRIFFLLSCR